MTQKQVFINGQLAEAVKSSFFYENFITEQISLAKGEIKAKRKGSAGAQVARPGDAMRLVLFTGDAAAVAVPVEIHPQAVAKTHTIHNALAQQLGHFIHVLVGQHTGRAFG